MSVVVTGHLILRFGRRVGQLPYPDHYRVREKPPMPKQDTTARGESWLKPPGPRTVHYDHTPNAAELSVRHPLPKQQSRLSGPSRSLTEGCRGEIKQSPGYGSPLTCIVRGSERDVADFHLVPSPRNGICWKLQNWAT